MTIVMFIILDICAVEMRITWTLLFRIGQGQSKYANRKTICDFISLSNNNVFLICHYFRDIHSKKVYNIELEL